VSRHLQLRLAQHPKAVQDIRWKAQGRLCTRYRKRIARGRHANQVVGAIAREWMGCMWAIANESPVTPSDQKTDHNQPVTQQGSGVRRQRRSPRVVSSSTAYRGLYRIRVPRARPAPDGGTEGGSQPTASRRINRRLFLAPTLLRREGHKTTGRPKKSCSLLLTSAVISTLGLSRCRKRERRWSGRWRQSGAAL